MKTDLPNSAIASEDYPIYFEGFLRRLGVSNGITIASLVAIMGAVFLISDYVAGIPSLRHLVVILALLISIGLSLVLGVMVRDRTVEAYIDLLGVIDLSLHDKLLAIMKTAFDQRRGIAFAIIVSAGGIVHHIILSYVEWGSIWWYTIVDIAFVGFAWWFIVAMFLWLCLGVAWSSFIVSRRLKFRPTVISDTNMCGLDSYATLSIVPAVAWASVVTFGTLSTFDPFIAGQHPQLILVYLILDFVIVAGSMTAIFAPPILGFRAIILPFKKSLHTFLIAQASQFSGTEKFATANVDDNSVIKATYLLELSAKVNQIKEWPLGFGSGIRFILSYLIPISIYVGRVILLAVFNVQIPV